MSENEKRLVPVIRVLVACMIVPYAVTVLAWIMPTGFIILIPFVAVGIWSAWPKVQHARETRRFRKELDRDLRFATDRDRL